MKEAKGNSVRPFAVFVALLWLLPGAQVALVARVITILQSVPLRADEAFR